MSGTGGGTALLRGHRVIWLIAIVAVVSLVAGVVLSRFIQSPSDAAAKAQPPTAGLITVPVENKVIANDVTMRADIVYDEAVEVTIETGEISGAAVVTGKVPEVGTEVTAASVFLEIAGRPVIALPGELPAYRSLRVGVSGPDVLQLKQALSSLGINPGSVESDSYDARTAAAVDELYVMAGYPSPAASEESQAALTSARATLTAAQDMLTSADVDLASAKSGPSKADRMAADNAVNSAQRNLDTARAVRDAPPEVVEGVDGAPAVEVPKDQRALDNAVADAEEALNLEIVRRADLIAGSGSATQQASRNSASQAVTDAQTAVNEAVEATLTSFPASEVTYFAALPRRVDDVTVTRGETVTSAKAVMSVSGADIVMSGSVGSSDAALLQVGMVGAFPLPDDTSTTATITGITPAEGASAEGESGDSGAGANRFTVLFTPDALTPELITQLQGSNVKVTVAVNSTGDKVLAVPSAALTAGPSGESRVERKVTGDTTELITVQTGLAASGYVQIMSAETPLSDGDLLVVGK